jgi:predicted nuclease with TOPRIM domain
MFSYFQVSELEGCHEQEQMQPLLEKLSELQAENTELRDRNDELTVEVEALTAKLASLKTKKYVGNIQYLFTEKHFLV